MISSKVSWCREVGGWSGKVNLYVFASLGLLGYQCWMIDQSRRVNQDVLWKFKMKNGDGCLNCVKNIYVKGFVRESNGYSLNGVG